MENNIFEGSKWYAVTLTFFPYYSPGEKFKLIDKVPKLLLGQQAWYSIEYHKKPNSEENDVFRPHVHILLKMTLKSNSINVKTMIQNFSKNYGRTDFRYLNTAIDTDQWLDYIKKDVELNNTLYPTYQHWKEWKANTEITDEDIEKEEEFIKENSDFKIKKRIKRV